MTSTTTKPFAQPILFRFVVRTGTTTKTSAKHVKQGLKPPKGNANRQHAPARERLTKCAAGMEKRTTTNANQFALVTHMESQVRAKNHAPATKSQTVKPKLCATWKKEPPTSANAMPLAPEKNQTLKRVLANANHAPDQRATIVTANAWSHVLTSLR